MGKFTSCDDSWWNSEACRRGFLLFYISLLAYTISTLFSLHALYTDMPFKVLHPLFIKKKENSITETSS